LCGVFYFKAMLHILLALLIALFSIPRQRPPAGTLKVSGLRNTFLDKAEVTNNQYRVFLDWLQTKENREAYSSALPDSMLWRQAYGVSFSSENQFGNYPVVGVSFEQAQRFCKWRSQLISEKEKRDVEFSLPELKLYKISVKPEDKTPLAGGLYSSGLVYHGFLGLCDNASELLSARGVAIAGGDADCLSLQPYEKAGKNLGFRCMAVLK